MLFSGKDAAVVAIAVALGETEAVGDARWKKVKKLTASAAADPKMAINSTDVGQAGALIGRTGTAACFHLFPRLSFSGRCGLPMPFL